MYQNFDTKTQPECGPARLTQLREVIAGEGLAGFIVPRWDRFRGEYVAPADERLAWLTGFSGSFGICVVLPKAAGLFVDSRYELQVKNQTADVFTPLVVPGAKLATWISEQHFEGAIGFDPWLYAISEITLLSKELAPRGITLRPCANLVDRIWQDRPTPPMAPAYSYPQQFSGESTVDKRARIGAALRQQGVDAAVLTQPDSIAWLLNIRGADVAHVPIMHAMAILSATGQVSLFAELSKIEGVASELGTDVSCLPEAVFDKQLAKIKGTVLVDPKTCPNAVATALGQAGAVIRHGDDPCTMPKACKNPAELGAARAAHRRDAVAMCRFLAWLDRQEPGTFTEIDVVRALEEFRRENAELRDISFDTISGAGPNGAIVHYRVTHESNRTVNSGELLLIDSGGQYLDGTTDITRTLAVGQPSEEMCQCYTRVLKGLIAVSLARWPKGLPGSALDPFARRALWQAGQDYGHGTGHGVGAFLSVHEGPQRIARGSEVPLQPGMILSNEPGFYREGQFGIRIENLVVVEACPLPERASVETLLCFETLTHVPLDPRLIDAGLLDADERAWVNEYHVKCREQVAWALNPEEFSWLECVTKKI